ncbi:MAG TPA: hypothetical protein VJC21_05495 [Candidatus Nanoarchaeia archaeon]|nr:hypothetical protein [Candidatus Nanoarchaeia archaeon]
MEIPTGPFPSGKTAIHSVDSNRLQERKFLAVMRLKLMERFSESR